MSKLRIDWGKAIAELVIIIAGVLIALAANDWRESVHDAAEAASYRMRLDDALGSDLREYSQTVTEAEQIDVAAIAVLSVYRGQEVPQDEAGAFVGDVLKASWMPPPAVSRDTYADLVSTGNLRLLPINLREQLGAYYAQVDVYDDREKIFRERLSSGYWKVPARVLGPDLLPMVWRAMAGAPADQASGVDGLRVSDSELQAVIARLRAIPDLETLIADVRHVMTQREVNYGSHMADQARQVQDILVDSD